MRSLSLAALALPLTALRAQADSIMAHLPNGASQRLHPGAPVRVRAGGGWQAGWLQRVGPDTIWLLTPAAGGPVTAVPLAETTRIEVRRRATVGEGMRRGAWRGIETAFVTDVAWCLAAQRDCKHGRNGIGGLALGTLRWAPFLSLGGVLYGAPAGAIFRGDRWAPIRPPTS